MLKMCGLNADSIGDRDKERDLLLIFVAVMLNEILNIFVFPTFWANHVFHERNISLIS